MVEEKRKRIVSSYKDHDEEGVSTERLLQMVADDCGCDVSDVCEALFESDETTRKSR